MATPSKFKVTGLGRPMENAKVNVDKLYLRQIFGGEGMNQSVVIHRGDKELGTTIVNNWGIYDGPGSEAKRVAKAYGMQTRADKWNNWFTMVFEDERFKGSTLQVMGANDETEKNEWAIVGGTGEFSMARGIIERSGHYDPNKNTLTQELTIEFICRMKKEVIDPPSPVIIPPMTPACRKRGPWGGNGGSLKDFEGKSRRLESLTIYHEGTVEGFQFSYVNEDGQIRTTGIFGITHNRRKNEINFGPSEYVKQLTGAGHLGNPSKLCQFMVVTNYATYGPFGDWKGTPFSFTVPENETVVGFYGSTDHENYITTIGVYTIPAK